MDKIAYFILVILFCGALFFSLEKSEYHKVLQIDSPYEIYVDFNDNQTAEKDELVALPSKNFQYKNLSTSDALRMYYLADNYAKTALQNKFVKVIQKDTGVSIIDNNLKDYYTNLEKQGLVLNKDNKKDFDKNLNYARTLNLVVYNTYSHKYHTLDCKHATVSKQTKILQKSHLPKNAQPCKWCHTNLNNKTHTKNKITQTKYPKDVKEKYLPIYKDNYLEFYVTDFTKYYYPSEKCLTTACQSLLREINTAKNSIDFAIYGVDRQPEITNALINAKNRGVKIRWVFDTNSKGNTIYLETFKLKKLLPDCKRDIDTTLSKSNNGQKAKDAIMHNKFFIFDNQKVWTGSANISNTDLPGFNANSAVLINSASIAKIYKAEFEQMFAGKFHKLKTPTQQNTTTLGHSKISVYFSPQDEIITQHILPLINSAKKYIYIPVFVITHKQLNQALISAKARGVDVKIIVDATSAGSKYSSVKYLRENGISAKTENRAGKMHMKSIIIDDKYSIIGSMNFTKSGEKYNDENVVIIDNSQLTAEFKKQFLHFWYTIPEKWMHKNPSAESHNSINSCYDGVDNDFDGKIDMNDDSCNFKLKKQEPKIKN